MWYETLLPKILNMSITGSIVIGILLILRPLLKRAPRIYAYSLWAVVLLRLLCPVTLSAEFSLLQLFDLPVTESNSIEYIPNNIVSDPFPEVDFLVDTATDLVNDALPQGWEQVNDRPLNKYIAAATLVWLLGASALLAVSLRGYDKLQRSLRQARHLQNNIYLTAHLDTPLVIGLWQPKIYLPEPLSPAEQAYVLRHEQYHIRRFDHILRLLSFIALCIHWFNPLVWVAFYLSERDMEMSCDEAVVKDLDNTSRCDYSQTLLQLASGQKHAGGPLCFSEGDPKLRIRNVLKWKPASRRKRLLWGGICLLLCISLMTDPVFAIQPEDPFQGRIHLSLPVGYDYTLLDDPKLSGTQNIEIYRTQAESPIAERCFSLDFTPDTIPEYATAQTITLSNGINAVLYGYSDWKNLVQLFCKTEEYGTVQIISHNISRSDDESRAAYQKILETMTITGPSRYKLFNLTRKDHLTVSLKKLDDYSFWTDEGSFCVDLAGASGTVTVSLYEVYSDRLVAQFVTGDAARDDHHVFTGLTGRKEYYLAVTGSDGCTVTVFD